MPPLLHFCIFNATVHYLPPTLRCSHEFLLYFIAREVNTRQPKHTLGAISSLDALPRDLKKQLKHISILAYEGVMNNKIVFTQDELPSMLPRSSWDMILNFLSHIFYQQQPHLHNRISLPWECCRGSSGHEPAVKQSLTTSFISRSKKCLLPTVSPKWDYFEQVRVFQTLLGEPRFAAVLQFYAGFTKLTNRGVRNIMHR